MSWRPITKEAPRPFQTVLTQHEDDLYPVCAFRFDSERDYWWREVEGPEDITRPGSMAPLYRAPTHWQPTPTSPRVEAERADQKPRVIPTPSDPKIRSELNP